MNRMPERDLRAQKQSRFRLTNMQWGVLLLVLVVAGSYLAFTKHIPFTGHGYELSATFNNSVNIRTKSPVRIAGVTVGEVRSVESAGDFSTVNFTVSEEGRPVGEDAFVAVRPRMFLEGNFFLDLQPGSPTAEELPDGSTIPVTRTSTAVQFDEILSALQSDTRQDLGRLLIGYGKALNHQPTAAEDRTQDPEVQGKSGAEALNMAFDYGPRAGRGSAQVLEAFRGTQPEDLRRLIRSTGSAFTALASQEGDLQELITNWNVFTGALASESANLSDTVRLLGPTVESVRKSMRSLNATLPPLRTFSTLFTPAVEELPATYSATRPWLRQAYPLLAPKQTGEIAELLRRSTPGYAQASASGYGALGQLTALSLCTTDVLVPTGNQVIADPFSTGQPNYREFFYSVIDLAGESQNFDGNGPYLKLQPGGGTQLTRTTDPKATQPTDRFLWANTFEAPIGTQPLLTPKPAYKPKAKCHQQGVPNLNGPAAGPGASSPGAFP